MNVLLERRGCIISFCGNSLANLMSVLEHFSAYFAPCLAHETLEKDIIFTVNGTSYYKENIRKSDFLRVFSQFSSAF